ncbi:unnamed protein product [Gongylonema pulchrum]|uniref:PEST proteolytic signal-containing nuclear protein n=1 Tax=Gongylonema pulchrum TaxID=637853 RepID=A0A183EJH5_9BILA|nr:unnamed protein product [Gongylonema pulchrum]
MEKKWCRWKKRAPVKKETPAEKKGMVVNEEGTSQEYGSKNPTKAAAQLPSQATSEDKREVAASPKGMLDDDKPVLVSGPACQELEIIRAKRSLNSDYQR